MKSNILIVILIVTAIVLGVKIIDPSWLQMPTFEKDVSKSEPKQESSQSEYPAIPIREDLTEEEKDLLTVPSSDAPKDEIEAHIALGAKLAKEAEVLEITDCEPKPLVFKVKEKAMFKVFNKDDIDHTLIIDPEHKYPLPRQETTEIKADFGKPPGLYGYVCEGVGLTGFIFVY